MFWQWLGAILGKVLGHDRIRLKNSGVSATGRCVFGGGGGEQGGHTCGRHIYIYIYMAVCSGPADVWSTVRAKDAAMVWLYKRKVHLLPTHLLSRCGYRC